MEQAIITTVLLALVGCSEVPATDLAEVQELKQRVSRLEDRLLAAEESREKPASSDSQSNSYPLTRDDLKFLVSKGTGRDYFNLTANQREYFSKFLQQLMKASASPQEIQQYLDGVYDGSQPAIMNQEIGEMAAAAITMIEGIDATKNQ